MQAVSTLGGWVVSIQQIPAGSCIRAAFREKMAGKMLYTMLLAQPKNAGINGHINTPHQSQTQILTGPKK
jgi:hypothetical protein